MHAWHKILNLEGSNNILKIQAVSPTPRTHLFPAQHRSFMMFSETDIGVRTFAVGMCAYHSF